MVTMSAANTTAVKNFDLDAFVLGFKTPQYDVPMYRRVDLIPEITKLDEQIKELEKKAAEAAPRKSYSNKDNPADQAEIDRLTVEYNAMVTEFEASKVVFQFRPFTAGELKQYVVRTNELGKADETDVPMYAEGLALTCASHPLSPEGWLKLCDAVGTSAFLEFARSWQAALSTGGSPDAPFSRRSSPAPSTEKPSAG